MLESIRQGEEPVRKRRRWRGAATVLVLMASYAAFLPSPVPRVSGGAELAASAGPVLPGTSCRSFPGDSVWNTPITSLPVDAHSPTWLAAMDASTALLHPDYGPSGSPQTPYGIPWTVVTPSTPLAPITFQYASESNPGPYPFTATTSIEGGPNATGDRHAIMVNSSTCTLFELWNARYRTGASTAGSGAIWSLASDGLRPAGWTSADAAGLPILPLLVNYDEVSSGVMHHAIRVTAACTQQSFLWPARHEAGQANAGCPPMGTRLRLQASFSLPSSECSTFCQTVIATMKTYGLIIADNGSNWYFQGTMDTRWTYSQVDELKQIPARAFQVVNESCLQVNGNSAQAYQPGTPEYASRCATGATNDCHFGTATVGIAAVNIGGSKGYLRADRTGQVCASGAAAWHGDLAGVILNDPITAITATADGHGYWLLGADGGVFSYGDARFYGSTGDMRLNAPIAGMAVTPDGKGYWIVAKDGGIFTFGDARFHGSTGNLALNRPVVGMAVAPRGDGYWLVASDGGVFTFTPDGFDGSLGSLTLSRPIVGMSSTADSRGYTLVGSDGGVFAFGDAGFYGSLGSNPPATPIVGLATAPANNGYYLADSGGQVFAFGPGA